MKRAAAVALALGAAAALYFALRGLGPGGKVPGEEARGEMAHRLEAETGAGGAFRREPVAAGGTPAARPAGVADSSTAEAGRSRRVEPGRIARAEDFVPSPVAVSDRSPLADRLWVGDEGEDVRVVAGLFEEYRRRFGAMPGFEGNADAVRALAGANPGRLAILPADHPAVGADGLLRDRWGTPYFFHAVSRDLVEVRSAGPDREFYTADDPVFAPRRGGN